MNHIAKYFYSGILLISILFLSCEKETVNEKQCKVLETKVNGTLKSSYKYNSDNKVSDIVFEQYHTRYNYSGNLVTVETKLDIGVILHTITYKLDKNGFASASFFSSIHDSMNGWQDSTYYAYDSEGFLIKEEIKHFQVSNGDTSSIGSSIINYEISGGNTISATETFAEGEMATRYDYADTIDKAHIDSEPFLGRPNKNLVKKITFENPGAEPNVITYDYVLNENGYPASKTETSVDSKDVYSYQYLCN